MPLRPVVRDLAAHVLVGVRRLLDRRVTESLADHLEGSSRLQVKRGEREPEAVGAEGAYDAGSLDGTRELAA